MPLGSREKKNATKKVAKPTVADDERKAKREILLAKKEARKNREPQEITKRREREDVTSLMARLKVKEEDIEMDGDMSFTKNKFHALKSCMKSDESEDIDRVDYGKKQNKSKKKKKLANKTKVVSSAEDSEDLETEIVIESNKLDEIDKQYDDFSVSQAAVKAQSTVNTENSLDVIVEKFSLSAPGRDLLVNADLRLVYGRRYGLVGPNGHGKTSLLSHIALKKLNGIPSNLDILLCEQEVSSSDKSPIQILLESDTESSRLKSQLQQYTEIYENKDFSEAKQQILMDKINNLHEQLSALEVDTAESRAHRILNGLGFSKEMQKRQLKNFSGGWRMRVSLARALFRQPSLLLLDEPTNHLDLNAVIWLDHYLRQYKHTLLVVSHDQNFLDNVCTDIMHLDQQKLNYYKARLLKKLIRGEFSHVKSTTFQIPIFFDKNSSLYL